MTYEYTCEACGRNWDLEQKITEKPILQCPHCGKQKAKRLISGGTGFQLMGGGWAAESYSK